MIHVCCLAACRTQAFASVRVKHTLGCGGLSPDRLACWVCVLCSFPLCVCVDAAAGSRLVLQQVEVLQELPMCFSAKQLSDVVAVDSGAELQRLLLHSNITMFQIISDISLRSSQWMVRLNTSSRCRPHLGVLCPPGSVLCQCHEMNSWVSKSRQCCHNIVSISFA